MGKMVIRVRLEPALESSAAGYDIEECRRMAKMYRRWARQLEIKARILALDGAKLPKKVPRMSQMLLGLN